MNKKVLIITYYWPPSGGSGVQRWLYFSRYLKKKGITPYIITVNEKYASYKYLDKELEKEIPPNLNVLKTKTLEFIKYYSWLIKGHKRKGIPQGEVSHKKNVLKKIASFIRGNFFIPDGRMGWGSFCFAAAKKLITEENISKVITTGPPHSTHLVGLKLKKTLCYKMDSGF